MSSNSSSSDEESDVDPNPKSRKNSISSITEGKIKKSYSDKPSVGDNNNNNSNNTNPSEKKKLMFYRRSSLPESIRSINLKSSKKEVSYALSDKVQHFNLCQSITNQYRQYQQQFRRQEHFQNQQKRKSKQTKMISLGLVKPQSNVCTMASNSNTKGKAPPQQWSIAAQQRLVQQRKSEEEMKLQKEREKLQTGANRYTPVRVRDVLLVNNTTCDNCSMKYGVKLIKESRPKKKILSFNHDVCVMETYDNEDYSREVAVIKLSVKERNQIREEIIAYKTNDMVVHDDSLQYLDLYNLEQRLLHHKVKNVELGIFPSNRSL
eukprot:Pgem_evm1s1054